MSRFQPKKLCATFKAANGTDVLGLHANQTNSNNFTLYSITSAGINLTPVVYSAGTVTPFGDEIGYMNFSPNGQLLAFGDYEPNMQVFTFNNATGAITAFFSDNNLITWPYSCEFSPSSRYLYVGNNNGSTNQILQYDMQAGSNAAILASKTQIATSTAGNYFGAMQIAPDGKIYTGQQGGSTLSVINCPNSPGHILQLRAGRFDLSRWGPVFSGFTGLHFFVLHQQ